jgi:branched-chain amino acid transport system ATP-binding protein
MTAALDARVTVGYGRLVVARDVAIDVDPGEVFAIIGPNGAGKTSWLLTLAGLLAPISGTISVAGETMKLGSPRDMSRAGVVLVPDNRALFTQLTTIENLEVARRKDGLTVDGVLELFPILHSRARVRAGTLSGGEQQVLALARALVQRPRVLLIDEMSMGLAPLIIESMVATIRMVAESTDMAVVLVEQHVRVALDAADRALVMVHGDVVRRGTAAEIRADADELQRVYLGGPHES